MIDTSPEENIQDSKMTQGENKEVVRFDKRKKYSDSPDKTIRTYKDKDKIEYEKLIISTFVNETKIDVNTTLEVHSECGIMSMFKTKETKNTEERKMKGTIITLHRNEK